METDQGSQVEMQNHFEQILHLKGHELLFVVYCLLVVLSRLMFVVEVGLVGSGVAHTNTILINNRRN